MPPDVYLHLVTLPKTLAGWFAILAVFWISGCSVQKRTTAPGWHVEKRGKVSTKQKFQPPNVSHQLVRIAPVKPSPPLISIGPSRRSVERRMSSRVPAEGELTMSHLGFMPSNNLAEMHLPSTDSLEVPDLPIEVRRKIHRLLFWEAAIRRPRIGIPFAGFLYGPLVRGRTERLCAQYCTQMKDVAPLQWALMQHYSRPLSLLIPAQSQMAVRNPVPEAAVVEGVPLEVQLRVLELLYREAQYRGPIATAFTLGLSQAIAPLIRKKNARLCAQYGIELKDVAPFEWEWVQHAPTPGRTWLYWLFVTMYVLAAALALFVLYAFAANPWGGG